MMYACVGDRFLSTEGNIFRVVVIEPDELFGYRYGVQRENATWDEGMTYWWVEGCFVGLRRIFSEELSNA